MLLVLRALESALQRLIAIKVILELELERNSNQISAFPFKHMCKSLFCWFAADFWGVGEAFDRRGADVKCDGRKTSSASRCKF